jgi:hypothetical protein
VYLQKEELKMDNKSENAIIALLVCLTLMILGEITGTFNIQGAILYFAIWTCLNTISKKE